MFRREKKEWNGTVQTVQPTMHTTSFYSRTLVLLTRIHRPTKIEIQILSTKRTESIWHITFRWKLIDCGISNTVYIFRSYVKPVQYHIYKQNLKYKVRLARWPFDSLALFLYCSFLFVLVRFLFLCRCMKNSPKMKLWFFNLNWTLGCFFLSLHHLIIDVLSVS